LIKEGKTIAKRNKGELGALGRNLMNTALDVASSKAPEDAFKEALKDKAKQTGHLALRDAGTRRGIYTDANHQRGQYKPVVVDEDVSAGINSGLGGNRLLNNTNVNPSAQARMAHARSFKKKKGESMRPLGGSNRPL
jgi:hypothetical protein